MRVAVKRWGILHKRERDFYKAILAQTISLTAFPRLSGANTVRSEQIYTPVRRFLVSE
jgi:hypothetical protein